MKEKMISTAKKLDMFASVFGKLIVGAAIVLLVLLVAIVVTGSSAMLSSSLQLGGVTLELADGTIQSDKAFYAGMLLAVIALLITALAMKVIREMLRPIKNGRPFDEACCLGIRKLAIIVLVGGVIWQIGENIATWVQVSQINSMLASIENVTAVRYAYSINLSFVVYAILLLFLSYIFRYGEMLQIESDETL